jgi:hypothetical protein
MIKKNLFIIMIVGLFLLMFTGLVGASYIFFDDFNRVNSSTIGNDWQEFENGNGNISIASNELKVLDESSSGNVYVYKILDLKDFYSIKWKMKTDDPNSGYKFQLGGQMERTILLIASNGNLMSNDGSDGVDDIVYDSLDTNWHTYEIRNMSDSSRTFDLYVDGVYEGSSHYDIGAGFNVNSNDNILITTSNADTPINYFDDIMVCNASSCDVQSSSNDFSCGGTIVEDITLTDNLKCDGNALTISGDNIIIDCDYHSIVGDGTGYGFFLDESDNVELKNCLIHNFNIGVKIVDSNGYNIHDNGITTINKYDIDNGGERLQI